MKPTTTPVFDPKVALGVTPKRHEGTARTVAFHQVDGERTHLFSATGQFIATVKSAQRLKPVPAAEPPPAPAGAAPTQPTS